MPKKKKIKVKGINLVDSSVKRSVYDLFTIRFDN